MKLRLIGTEQEFKLLDIDSMDRNKFDSFRKPQKGGNPKYKDSDNRLMYVELTAKQIAKMFFTLRK